jgi:short subunit dehydrogenase-like uncharacterized protein
VTTGVSGRDYDVVLYGAGGFTGRQTVAYFTAHAASGLRWGIAGPRRHTLEAARGAAGARLADTDLMVAPSQDQAAIAKVVGRARVVLSTAGPFALYGTPIVDTCVRLGTHYVDITGETPWMRDIAARYHEPAAANGTRIIPCCGFDSVPSDLGTMLMARHVRESMGVPCQEVRSYFQFSGGLNGGTVASLLNMLKNPRRQEGSATPKARDGRIRMIKSPRYDPELGTWIGPFVMAPTNTQVVCRSLLLSEECGEPYGNDFVYQEAMKYDRPFARTKATGASLGRLESAADATCCRALFAKAWRRALGPHDGQRVVHVRSPGHHRGWSAGARTDSLQRRSREPRDDGLSVRVGACARNRGRQPSGCALAGRRADSGDGTR